MWRSFRELMPRKESSEASVTVLVRQKFDDGYVYMTAWIDYCDNTFNVPGLDGDKELINNYTNDSGCMPVNHIPYDFQWRYIEETIPVIDAETCNGVPIDS